MLQNHKYFVLECGRCSSSHVTECDRQANKAIRHAYIKTSEGTLPESPLALHSVILFMVKHLACLIA